MLTSFHKQREFDISVYSCWQRPCKFIELRAFVEFFFVETTFIFGINHLVAVLTTLHLVWLASYLSSKRLPG